MPGPTKKQTGRQRRNESPALAPVIELAERRTVVPAPNDHWSAATLEDWRDAWLSDLGTYWLESTDLAVLRRLFDLRDEHARISEQFLTMADLVTEGSTGQKTAHPLVKIRDNLATEIRNLEDRVGLSPMARLKLGLKLGEAGASLAALNTRLRGEPDDDDRPDPRTVIDLGGAQ